MYNQLKYRTGRKPEEGKNKKKQIFQQRSTPSRRQRSKKERK